MRLTAWLIRRRDTAATTWLEHERIAGLLVGTPSARAASLVANDARGRLARWDRALDLWTRRGTRRT